MRVSDPSEQQRSAEPESVETTDLQPLLFQREQAADTEPSVLYDLVGKIKELLTGQDAATQSVRTATDPRSSAAPKSAADLIGKTVRPEAVKKVSPYLNVDHLGKITGTKLRGHLLTRDQLSQLSTDLIPDLVHTNSPGPRDVPRTNREVILEMITSLQAELAKTSEDDQENHALLSRMVTHLRTFWLGGELGSDKSIEMLDTAHSLLAESENYSVLARQAQALAKEASARKLNIQKQDNTFGRKFESELVHELIKSPPDSIKNAALETGHFLKNSVTDQLSPEALDERLSAIAEAIAKDPRPWLAETPEIKQFVDAPTREHFEKMMNRSLGAESTGYDVIKQSYLGAKISLIISPPWMTAANFNYNNVLKPSRSSTPSVLGDIVRRTPTLITELKKQLSSDARLLATKGDSDRKLAHARDMLAKLEEPIRAGDLVAALGEIIPTLPDCYSKTLSNKILAELKQQPEDSGLELDTDPLAEGELSRLKKQGIDAHRATTRTYGTRLPHHPENPAPPSWMPEKSVQASVNLNLQQPKAFEQKQLDNDQNLVVGLSGTTNIMSALYLHMQKHALTEGDTKFDITDALAGTLMFVVFDGGHSIPESLAAFRSMVASAAIRGNVQVAEADQSVLAKQASQKEVAQFTLDYNRLPEQFASKDTEDAIRSAIHLAFDQTCDLFTKLHGQRLGQEHLI